ncbi:hypothetical protein WSM22_43060 [Cytophagales bacterium WSM2-2]|nr:hypothetical protein WSM22_43060 [Cytophagales bacterium WSM2-2]
MENGSELREENEAVLEGIEPSKANGISIPGDDHSYALHDDKVEEVELHDAKPIDYSNLGKQEFVGLLKEAASKNDFKKADEIIREVKPLFDEIRNREKAEALARFKLDGGNEDDFQYKGDEWDIAFDIYLKSIRDNRQRHFRELEEQKNTNLFTKNNILETLRQLVDSEDTEHTLRQFKEIEKEWKAVGPVPQAHMKTLWANYNALVDRFYDQRSIYFELKELDRRKNLELKYDLCARAEKLLAESKISAAVKELNELHHEFRHIGPVPMEEKEAVWQKFKTASDAIYAKRDSFVADLQQEFQANLVQKEKINEEIVAYATFQSDSIKEWNQKTKDVIELQKRWEAVGGVPRSKMREVNKKFWAAFKTFFHNKSVFFKQLDGERAKNLQLKTEILNRAVELKDSTDWENASNELKELQVKWKEIGTVPEKYREKIFQQFKEACDHFFEHRRVSNDKELSEQKANLEKKEAIIALLEKIAEEKAGSLQQVKELQSQFMNIGFVPKRAVNSVKSRFTETLDKAIAALPDLGTEERDQAAFEVRLNSMKQSPQGEKKIHHKEHHLRKQIARAENDIATLRNNLEFFGRSKNAEKMKEEFNAKIRQADDEILHLKKQLQMLQASV